MECPNCKENFRPPIFLCNNGHPVCLACHSGENAPCLCCGATISDNRSKELEKLYLTLKMKIACINFGCTFKAEEGQMFRHLNKCMYQIVKCLDPLCQWEGPYSQFELHLEENHNM